MIQKKLVLLAFWAGLLFFTHSYAEKTQKKCENCSAPFFMLPFLDVFNPGPTFSEPF